MALAWPANAAAGGPQTGPRRAVPDGAGAAGSVLLVDAAPARPPAAVHEGPAVLPLAGPGRRGDRYAPDAVILGRSLDHGEERAGY